MKKIKIMLSMVLLVWLASCERFDNEANGRLAGTYTRPDTSSTVWTRQCSIFVDNATY